MMAGVSTALKLLRCGDDAVLVELQGLRQVLELNRALQDQRPDGALDVIPAARTVMVQFDTTRTSYQQIAQWISRTRTSVDDWPDTAATVTVPVRYDGADLAEVAEMRNLTPEQVTALHREPEYTVAFCGFAPGFAYLVGSPAVLHVSRRTSPRTEVPAGSVGLAGEFTGIYPAASPGGWQLIGTTDLPLFDIDRDPPSLLAPGTRVRFIEAR